MDTFAGQPLRVLLVEDSDSDADLVVDHLKRAGFEPTWVRVQNEGEFVGAVDPTVDVILADFNMPSFGAARALELLKERELEVPLIVVSGSIGEEKAVTVLHSGAADYLLKDRLARLGQAVRRVVTERRLQLEKRRAEQALEDEQERTRFALQAARVGVWEADLTTGAARWSETLEALHGMPAGTFGGTFGAFLERIHPDDRDNVRTSIDDATRHHTDSNILYRSQWPDGTMHWISGTGRTFYDHTGIPVRAAGVGLDVTERHILEERNRQSQRVEAVGQLAGGVAHDFNNLLTVIQGYCELLSDELGPESVCQSSVVQIRRAADRAASLTRQLLAFSRRQILDVRVVDLRGLLRGLESMLKRLIPEHIAIVVRTTDETTHIKADPMQIEQVILNLAINARDAMPEGGSLLLEVTNTTLDDSYARIHSGVKPGRYVMLAVSDTGVGIDAVTQARIFEPFFTTKKAESGTGLGLSTVYGIVKQSGGNVWVYSEPGHGATFKVYLPRVDEVEDQPESPPALAVLNGTETILVVEDEPGVRELVRQVLVRRGYRVLVATTPHEGLEMVTATTDPIHLLLSDVMLPEMSGRALADQIVARRPGIRVIYMSGYTDHAIVHHGELEPDLPFLQKPFTPQALARKVREVLG